MPRETHEHQEGPDRQPRRDRLPHRAHLPPPRSEGRHRAFQRRPACAPCARDRRVGRTRWRGTVRQLPAHRRHRCGSAARRRRRRAPRLRLRLREPGFRARARRRRADLHRPDRRNHGTAGRQGAGQARGRAAGRAGDRGQRRRHERRRRGGERRARHAAAGAAEGRGRRRWPRHGGGREPRRPGRTRRKRDARGREGLRQWRADRRALSAARAPHRGAGRGRRAGPRDPPVRARVHAAAPSPEGDRGGAERRPAASLARASAGRCGEARRRRELPRPGHGRVRRGGGRAPLPRGQPAPAGRAPGDRGGDGARPGRVATAHRRHRPAAADAGRRALRRPRLRGAAVRRRCRSRLPADHRAAGPRRFLARGGAHRVGRGERRRDLAVLRLDDRQAGVARPEPRGRAPRTGCRSARQHGDRPDHQPAVPARAAALAADHRGDLPHAPDRRVFRRRRCGCPRGACRAARARGRGRAALACRAARRDPRTRLLEPGAGLHRLAPGQRRRPRRRRCRTWC